MATERLSKFLAQSGLASRRKSDEIIKAGRVAVNGQTVVEPYHQVDPELDRVTVDRKTVIQPGRHHYFILYKPVGYLSDLVDKRQRKLARDLIRTDASLFPVGRLDFNSEGLMIFTDDGEFANRVMHPRYGVEKEYLVKLSGQLDQDDMKRALQGIRLEGELYAAKEISFVRLAQKNAWYRVVVTEGKNRMLRKIGDALHHPVLRLKRIRVGPVTLGKMKAGEHRTLTPKEINSFRPA